VLMRFRRLVILPNMSRQLVQTLHLAFFILGLGSLSIYFSWWLSESRLLNPWIWLFFVFAIGYTSIQLLGNWILYLAAAFHKEARHRPELPKHTVDVFLTVYREDFSIIERALSAAVAMRIPHRTWLLDDSNNPQLLRMAEELGAGYLTRDDRKDAKAGNINAALHHTEGDIVVIFDIDHAPRPDFLEQTLGHFSDPKVGFVQVMLTFDNHDDGWVASAASDMSLDFYNPVSVGSDALGSTTLMGSNALIRRQALESIGGYQPGLAEDLATSLALHAEGWTSAYVHQPLAPGYAPPDLRAWFTQQSKWARGVFEIFIADFPNRLSRLTWPQRMTYAIRMTYYWIGLVIAAHLLVSIAVLFSGNPHALNHLNSYLWHLLPLGLITIAFKQLTLNQQLHPSVEARQPLKPLSLLYLTWPIYTIAWLMAMFRVPLRFRTTPKQPRGRLNLKWIVPQTIVSILLLLGLALSLPALIANSAWLVLGLVVFQLAGQLPIYVIWYKGNGLINQGQSSQISINPAANKNGILND
jgi:cellulose synthase (UDP-forming)